MSTNLENKLNGKLGAVVGGSMLMLFGALSLAVNFFRLSGFLFLLLPGMAFLAWGLLARRTGLVIPGCILSALGGAIVLIEGPLANAAEPVTGALFIIALASGFFLISLLSLYTERGRLAWWPLIPGGILGVVGGLLLGGQTGLRALEILGYGWPVALIALGLYLVLRRKDINEA